MIQAWVFFLAVVIATTPAARAEAISPAQRLRKLSQHLRGFPPGADEYEALLPLDPQAQEKYLLTKTDEYLRSIQHLSKMRSRLETVFRVMQPEIPRELTHDSQGKKREGADPVYTRSGGSTRLLFDKVIQQNLPWDQLYTAKDVTFSHVGTYDNKTFKYVSNTDLEEYINGKIYLEDASFYSSRINHQTSRCSLDEDAIHLPTFLTIQPLRPDANLAGAISSPLFFERFADTVTNVARRRAAAVFDIMLCDEMRPVSFADASEDKRLLEESIGRPVRGQPQSEHARTGRALERQHGTDAACMGCHSKLDPLARAFRGMGDRLSKNPSQGTLVFKIGAHSVQEKFVGLAGMTQTIVKQPEYVSCQTGRFWNWFIGEDVPLTTERHSILNRKFEEFGRRPREFIRYLVNQPEFYQKPKVDSPSAALGKRAAKILKDCTSCHSDSGEAPDLYPYPIRGTQELHNRWLRKIRTELDLDGNGSQRSMPPSYSGWDSSYISQSVQTIRDWLCAGAPNEDGMKTSESMEDLCHR